MTPRQTDASRAAADADAERLNALGYKEELKRSFSMFETFALAFSIIGLLPSIASTLVYGLTAGPSGLVWGWLSCAVFVLMIGVALGELSSAIPTAGGEFFPAETRGWRSMHRHTHICVHGLLTVVIGLYYWTYHYAPEGWKRFLSFLIAYANTLGNIGGVCSINYGVSCDALWCRVAHRG